MSEISHIVVGSRKSMLAKLQAFEVGLAIKKILPDISIEYKTIDSDGDNDQQKNLTSFSSTGIFTKTVTSQLTNKKIDCAVHSWKDLPTLGEPETEIIATLERADTHDVLLLNKKALHKEHLIILSSSPRRAACINEFITWGLPWVPKSCTLKEVRGNVDTRLSKLIEKEEGDGLILAKAGIDRLLSPINTDEEFKLRIQTLLSKTYKIVLPLSVFPCAPGQGAIAIEILKSDQKLRSIFNAVNHKSTFDSVLFERSFLKLKGGGCHSKVGACHVTHPAGYLFFSQSENSESINGLLRENLFKNNFTANTNTRAKNKLFSFKSNELKLTRTTATQTITLPENAGLFITKDAAIPVNQKIENKQNILWCSGIQTWKKLTGRGFLVNGCFDTKGDKEHPEISSLSPATAKWIKVTHDKGNNVNWAETIHTYKINFPKIPALSGYDYFFWSSFSEFEECLKSEASIANKHHSCGIGSTYEKLSKIIPKDKITVFLNHEDWVNFYS